jgi:hypothetical protein
MVMRLLALNDMSLPLGILLYTAKKEKPDNFALGRLIVWI